MSLLIHSHIVFESGVTDSNAKTLDFSNISDRYHTQVTNSEDILS